MCRWPALAARTGGCSPLSPDYLTDAGKACQLDIDCQSGACADGRCAEVKYCASRFLYDALGVNLQLRTYDGLETPLGHHEAIKCGQCICQDCPVSVRLASHPAHRRLSAGPAKPQAPPTRPCPVGIRD